MASSAIVAVALAGLAGACAARPTPPPAGPWQSGLGRDHPLAGRIWHVAAGRFLAPPALLERLAGARFVLLGEQHDNPDHHRLQAWVVRALFAAGRRPAVAFEMFSADDAPALAQHLATSPADAAGLGAAVGWDRSGWPPWGWYQPIADAALGAGVPIVWANLGRATTRTIFREGLAGLDPAWAAKLGLHRPLPPAVRAAMAAEIEEAHCGPLPDRLLDGMIAVQRARDAHMAERLATAGDRDGAVLIAGVGHIRRDRGVPVSLERLAPGARAITLAFLQVQGPAAEPEAYAAGFGPDPFPVDYLWFTPRVDDADPCEKYRAPLERLRRHQAE